MGFGAGRVFFSTTRSIPEQQIVPRHVAIIADGSERWAIDCCMPGVAGYQQGIKAVAPLARSCIERRIDYLTLFALNPGSWRHPVGEFGFSMSLFSDTLEQEIECLHQSGVRFRVIGDLSVFEQRLVDLVLRGENLTAMNDRLTLTIAVNYGGRWDLMQAFSGLSLACPEKAGAYTEADLEPFLAMNYAPEPDLFIRTGGEQCISNFLLWQLAYCELYFTEYCWPDFDEIMLDESIASFRRRERRFGRTSDQLLAVSKPAPPDSSDAFSVGAFQDSPPNA